MKNNVLVLNKRKIKEYRETIDVLSLSATPIPRTLQMSLMGIRGLSKIDTPPKTGYQSKPMSLKKTIH